MALVNNTKNHINTCISEGCGWVVFTKYKVTGKA